MLDRVSPRPYDDALIAALEFTGGRITCRIVVVAVAAHFRMPVGVLTSQRKTRDIVHMRWIGVAICVRRLGFGIRQAAEGFGFANHASGHHAVMQMDELRERSPEAAQAEREIADRLGLGDEWLANERRVFAAAAWLRIRDIDVIAADTGLPRIDVARHCEILFRKHRMPTDRSRELAKAREAWRAKRDARAAA